MFQRRSLVLAWGVFCFIACVLFNSCASHRTQILTGRYLSQGTWTASPSLLFRVLHVLGTDDGDIARYLAYSRAVLGQPYQSHFIRPIEEWRVDATKYETGKDISDPQETPPTVPSTPLRAYRDFLVEYPPGFFLFALPPALLATDLDRYVVLFGVYMALLLCGSLWLCVRVARTTAPDLPEEQIVKWSTLCLLALGTITMRRYDAAVSFSLALLVYGCVAKRPSLAGIGLGLGVVAKGLPVLLVPLPVLYYLSMRRWRELAIATTGGLFFGLLVGLPMVVPAGAHLFDILSYHGGRPLQIESTAGALLILSRLLPQSNVAITHTYGSMNLVGNGEPILRFLASVLPILSLLGVWLWSFFAFRRAPDKPARDRILLVAICLILVGQMALGKVFSPQYLTWLLPIGVLVSLREDFSGRSLFLGALLLTQLIFPICYRLPLVRDLSPIFGFLVLLRNCLILAWAVRLLRRVPLLPLAKSADSAAA